MDSRWKSGALITGLVFLLAACAPDAGEETGGEAETAEEAAPAAQQAQLPDTTAAAVWAYIHEEEYQSWRTWPGKGELYQGGEPHGALLTTYLNDIAYDALTNGQNPLPEGAIIIKNNYMPDSTLAAVTTMYKVEGFNPDHADWWFAKQQPDGTVDAAGRPQGCQACHGARSDNDYLLTGDIESVGGASGQQ